MKYTALIVDDDPASRYIYRQVLTAIGFEIIESSDGAQALEWLETGTPDVIFLDMLLPTVDGTEVLSFIRRTSHLKNVSVIVVSAHNGFRNSSMMAASDRFLLKPVLAKTIREVALHAVASSSRHA